MSRSYAVIGTGAIGGFYGACLAKVGFDVHFLVNRDFDHICSQGLQVQSVWGDFTLRSVLVYNNVDAIPPVDVVLLALKTTQNYLLPHLLAKICKPEGIVLVLQNGLGIEPIVAEIVGSKRVIGGMCFICAYKIAPGTIQHLDYGSITIGDYAPDYVNCGITPRMAEIAADFAQAGIKIDLQADLLLARWQKLVWNIPFNGLSVVLNATTDQMIADPQICNLIRAIMAEVAMGAAACQRPIDPAFLEGRISHTLHMQPYHTSMKCDFDRHQPLELNAIFGQPLHYAGIPLPRITMLYQQLQFLDRVNCH